MSKLNRNILIIVVVLTILCALYLTVGIYFASQLSSTYPPLKDYEYSVTARQMENVIFQIAKEDTSYRCQLTDSTGTELNRSYYFDITLKTGNANYLFYATLENKDKLWNNANYCNLGLVGAFDKTKNLGGYKNNREEIKNLVDLFEKTLIYRINLQIHNRADR